MSSEPIPSSTKHVPRVHATERPRPRIVSATNSPEIDRLCRLLIANERSLALINRRAFAAALANLTPNPNEALPPAPPFSEAVAIARDEGQLVERTRIFLASNPRAVEELSPDLTRALLRHFDPEMQSTRIIVDASRTSPLLITSITTIAVLVAVISTTVLIRQLVHNLHEPLRPHAAVHARTQTRQALPTAVTRKAPQHPQQHAAVRVTTQHRPTHGNTAPHEAAKAVILATPAPVASSKPPAAVQPLTATTQPPAELRPPVVQLYAPGPPAPPAVDAHRATEPRSAKAQHEARHQTASTPAPTKAAVTQSPATPLPTAAAPSMSPPTMVSTPGTPSTVATSAPQTVSPPPKTTPVDNQNSSAATPSV